jgi:hypothetical protein
MSGRDAGIESRTRAWHGLVLWHRWWEDHVDWCGSEETAGTDEEWRAWSEEGDRLLERLREQLGPAFQVQRV